jgi:branched-chain amino acid transport system ATP-binding protein
MAELALEGIGLRFGGLVVLESVSLAVERGELLALIGPNGAGKTSLLNCISGLYRPSAGAVRFRDRDLVGMRPHQIAALGVARTFQHGELFPHLTVVENLLVGRHARMRTGVLRQAWFSPGVRREEVEHREAVERILDFVELGRHRHALVSALPFGRQKLVGFARALAMEPAVLLLDEPSAGLNRDEREDLARFILRIKYELALPMIWIEHDMQMVADLADRLHVLDYGRTLAAGTADEVLRDPRVVAAYLGGAAAPA